MHNRFNGIGAGSPTPTDAHTHAGLPPLVLVGATNRMAQQPNAAAMAEAMQNLTDELPGFVQAVAAVAQVPAQLTQVQQSQQQQQLAQVQQSQQQQSQQLAQVQQSLQQLLEMMRRQERNAARLHNRLARMDDDLVPVPDANGNVPAGAPATPRELGNLDAASINTLLVAYALPVNGRPVAKRLRLANCLGVELQSP